MGIVQGTQRKVRFWVKDFDTGLPYDPPEITCKVNRSDGSTETLTKTGGQITNMVDAATNAPIVGRYKVDIDTSAVAGPGWRYEITVEDVNGNPVIRKVRSFDVDPAI